MSEGRIKQRVSQYLEIPLEDFDIVLGPVFVRVDGLLESFMEDMESQIQSIITIYEKMGYPVDTIKAFVKIWFGKE